MRKIVIPELVDRSVAYLFHYASSLYEGKILANDLHFERDHLLLLQLQQSFRQKKDQRALGVLDNFMKDPEEYKLNLRNKLIETLEDDPELVHILQSALQQFPVQEILVDDNSVADDNKQIIRGRVGIQRIIVDNSSRATGNSQDIS